MEGLTNRVAPSVPCRSVAAFYPTSQPHKIGNLAGCVCVCPGDLRHTGSPSGPRLFSYLGSSSTPPPFKTHPAKLKKCKMGLAVGFPGSWFFATLSPTARLGSRGTPNFNDRPDPVPVNTSLPQPIPAVCFENKISFLV